MSVTAGGVVRLFDLLLISCAAAAGKDPPPLQSVGLALATVGGHGYSTAMALHRHCIAVSYTHLTLPTIYSV